MKFGQNVYLDKISGVKNWVMWGKNIGQILELPCISSRGLIFSPILMKLGQNVCLDKISDELENGSCQVKNEVTRSNFRKILCVL